MSLSAQDIITRVRDRLRSLGIKLWLEPYYFEEVGSVESELDVLAAEFEVALGIPSAECKFALSELQDSALEKLRSREQNDITGEIIIKARIIKTGKENNDTTSAIELKYKLTIFGSEIYEDVSRKLKCKDNDLKIIFAGKVLQKECNLMAQGIRHNLQAIILISTENHATTSIHERVKKAKDDALLILSSQDQQFLTMEDQDGNLIHLPPMEKESLILALALYEKGRSALKRKSFDEALVLFLESDEQFSSSKSDILNNIDNYALLNLDIVWCYLCLKSFSYLPDAEKRLKICEENFRKSYGNNMNRVSMLKGNYIGSEKALIMRLHLLQGVLLFHQDKRNEAYEKFLTVEEEMGRLQIDEEKLFDMISMGYDLLECRIALIACSNNIELAINYITERRKKKKDARKRGDKEHNINKGLNILQDCEWINPKSVLNLVEMGFNLEIATIALKKSKNNLEQAIELIQNHSQELLAEIPNVRPNKDLVKQLCSLGFKKEMVEMALKTFINNRDETIDFLLKLESDNDINSILKMIEQFGNSMPTHSENEAGPSTSNLDPNIISIVKNKIEKEKEAKKAYDRFIEDVSTTEDEYLDIDFVQEKSILKEYQNLIMK